MKLEMKFSVRDSLFLLANLRRKKNKKKTRKLLQLRTGIIVQHFEFRNKDFHGMEAISINFTAKIASYGAKNAPEEEMLTSLMATSSFVCILVPAQTK